MAPTFWVPPYDTPPTTTTWTSDGAYEVGCHTNTHPVPHPLWFGHAKPRVVWTMFDGSRRRWRDTVILSPRIHVLANVKCACRKVTSPPAGVTPSSMTSHCTPMMSAYLSLASGWMTIWCLSISRVFPLDVWQWPQQFFFGPHPTIQAKCQRSTERI